jgi:hypothetical protein
VVRRAADWEHVARALAYGRRAEKWLGTVPDVVEQDPRAGTRVRGTTQVTIYVGLLS